MAVLSEHQTSVVVDGPQPVTLAVARQQITLDREWTPYVQAQLTCPLGDGEIVTLDPTVETIWATIRVRRLLGRIDRIGDLSLKYAGRTLRNITTEFAGRTLAGVTASTYHDYETPGVAKRVQGRDFRLIVRDMEIDYAEGQVTLSLESGEAKLLDDANTGPTFRVPGATQREKINWILARSGLGPTVTTWGFIQDAGMGEVANWNTGQTAWDVLTQLVRTSEGELWCDEAGQWWAGYARPAAPNGVAAVPPTRHLYSSGSNRSVVNAVEKRNRDQAYTAVIVTYTGGATTEYDVATTPGAPVIAYRITKDTPKTTGLAAAMLGRIRARGRALELLAVSDYATTPGDNTVFHNPRNTLSGSCSAVQWKWPEDEMSIRLRDVEIG